MEEKKSQLIFLLGWENGRKKIPADISLGLGKWKKTKEKGSSKMNKVLGGRPLCSANEPAAGEKIPRQEALFA